MDNSRYKSPVVDAVGVILIIFKLIIIHEFNKRLFTETGTPVERIKRDHICDKCLLTHENIACLVKHYSISG
jgi:hypothetical protein